MFPAKSPTVVIFEKIIPAKSPTVVIFEKMFPAKSPTVVIFQKIIPAKSPTAASSPIKKAAFRQLINGGIWLQRYR